MPPPVTASPTHTKNRILLTTCCPPPFSSLSSPCRTTKDHLSPFCCVAWSVYSLHESAHNNNSNNNINNNRTAAAFGLPLHQRQLQHVSSFLCITSYSSMSQGLVRPAPHSRSPTETIKNASNSLKLRVLCSCCPAPPASPLSCLLFQARVQLPCSSSPTLARLPR